MRAAVAAVLVAVAGPAVATTPLPDSSAARLAAVAADLGRLAAHRPLPRLVWQPPSVVAIGAGPLAVAEGALAARLSPGDGTALRLIVSHGGRQVLDAAARPPVTGAPSRYLLAVARLDAATATADVVAGAGALDEPCCRSLVIATAHSDGPGYDTVPGLPGEAAGPFRLVDLDGDGRHEIVAHERLAFTSGPCRPCRAEVPAMFGLATTTWRNRSAEPAFGRMQAAALADLAADVAAPHEGRDEAVEADFVLAAAAMSARLGVLGPAWDSFRRHDVATRPLRRAIAELLRERRFVGEATPLEPRR